MKRAYYHLSTEFLRDLVGLPETAVILGISQDASDKLHQLWKIHFTDPSLPQVPEGDAAKATHPRGQ